MCFDNDQNMHYLRKLLDNMKPVAFVQKRTIKMQLLVWYFIYVILNNSK